MDASALFALRPGSPVQIIRGILRTKLDRCSHGNHPIVFRGESLFAAIGNPQMSQAQWPLA